MDLSTLTLRRPLRRKLRMRWFFDVSMVKESSFFKSDLTDPPPQIFYAHLWKIQIEALPDFIFQWVLYQDHFGVRWFYSLFEPQFSARRAREGVNRSGA